MNVMTHARRGWTLVEMMIVILVISILVALSLSIGSAVLQGSEEQRTQNALLILESAMKTRMLEETRGSLSYGFDGDLAPRYTIDPADAVASAGSSCDSCGGLTEAAIDYRLGGLPSESDITCHMWSQFDGCSTFDTDDDVYGGVSAACMWYLGSHPASREILASMDPGLLMRVSYRLSNGDAEASIMPVDAWGNPVIVVLPGRNWDDRGDGASFGNQKRQDPDGTIRTKEEQVLGSALQGTAYFVSAGPDGKFGNIHNDARLVDGFTPDPEASDFQAALDNICSYEVHTW